jgi:hypothetical protein
MSAGQASLFEVEVDGVKQSLIEQIQARAYEPTQTQVDAAVDLIQRQLKKEAQNRQADMIDPEALCPAQQRDLIRDLARLLRE